MHPNSLGVLEDAILLPRLRLIDRDGFTITDSQFEDTLAALSNLINDRGPKAPPMVTARAMRLQMVVKGQPSDRKSPYLNDHGDRRLR